MVLHEVSAKSNFLELVRWLPLVGRVPVRRIGTEIEIESQIHEEGEQEQIGDRRVVERRGNEAFASRDEVIDIDGIACLNGPTCSPFHADLDFIIDLHNGKSRSWPENLQTVELDGQLLRGQNSAGDLGVDRWDDMYGNHLRQRAKGEELAGDVQSPCSGQDRFFCFRLTPVSFGVLPVRSRPVLKMKVCARLNVVPRHPRVLCALRRLSLSVVERLRLTRSS